MNRILTATLTATLMLAAYSASAQDDAPKVGDQIGDWTFQCQALSASETVCGLVQVVADQASGQALLTATLRRVGEEEKLGLFVTVPLGIFLGAGVAGKVDQGEQFAFALQSCTQRGCEVAIEVDDALGAALRKGNRLVVGFKAQATADALLVPVSLKGISQGLEAIRPR